MRIQKLVHNPLFLQQPARPLHHSLCCVVLRAHRKYQTRPISVDSELNHSLATRKLGLSVSQQDAITHQWLLVNRGWRAPLGLNGPVYLRCPPSCPQPQTPFQPPRAASSCVQGQSEFPMALPCLAMGPIKPGSQPSPTSREAPHSLQWSTQTKMEAMLCQTLTYHFSKTRPRTAVEDKIFPSTREIVTRRNRITISQTMQSQSYSS